ncbi:MAG TPA: cytochrome c, partial [Sphingomicrobium sp.]|nr:cytochrome c [Sphingomicrobium sp.]
IGKANKTIRDELQKDRPDLSVVEVNAAKIANLSQEATGWFHAGTGPETGKTGARPEIWQSPQDFSTRLATFQADARAFDDAAKSRDPGQIKARLQPLGDSCKACHDRYRSKMHH